jgi:hypothetical protein
MTSSELSGGAISSAQLMQSLDSTPVAALAPAADPKSAVEARINAGVKPGGQPLAVRSLELYVIRGLNTVDFGKGPVLVVAYDPEFLYVADVGLPARAGVSVSWSNVGAGDPTFPDFQKAKLRSITGAGPTSLIYPAIAGELLIGVDPATPHADIVNGLQAHGLWDVRITGSLIEARCDLFREADVCAALPGQVAFVRYAESNRVVRFVDIAPGWSATKIA